MAIRIRVAHVEADRVRIREAGRGCFRAEWRDEPRRERILDPPKPVKAPRQTQQQEQTQRIDRSEGGGLRM